MRTRYILFWPVSSITTTIIIEIFVLQSDIFPTNESSFVDNEIESIILILFSIFIFFWISVDTIEILRRRGKWIVISDEGSAVISLFSL